MDPSNEEIRTVFITGLPDDVKEREINLLFRYLTQIKSLYLLYLTILFATNQISTSHMTELYSWSKHMGCFPRGGCCLNICMVYFGHLFIFIPLNSSMGGHFFRWRGVEARRGGCGVGWGLHRERTVCYFPALIICCWFVLSMSNYECGCICMFRGAVLLSCPDNPVIAFYHRMSSPFLSALTTGHVVGPLSSFCANDAKLNHESLCTVITQCHGNTVTHTCFCICRGDNFRCARV